jgi:hypothetical protein
MSLNVPPPSDSAGKTEHRHLRSALQRAEAAGGRTGAAATEVMKVLFPHMVMEEEYAMPPLKLLPRIARGEVTPDMARVIPIARTLKAELPRMLEDHKQIVMALRRLMQAAVEEGFEGYTEYASKLIAHAQMEEEIAYPAAILVGEYLKQQFNMD